MSLAEKIQEDIKQAMKEKNTLRLNVLRDIKSGIQMTKIELKHDLNDEEVIDVISKKIKMRTYSIAEFTKANRTDLANQYQSEIDILNEYMPEQLSENEVIDIINKSFDDIKPTSIKDMGKIMKSVTPALKGRYDMSEVSQLIKDKLNNL